jgi:uncharacterized protein (TIGR03435 family)
MRLLIVRLVSCATLAFVAAGTVRAQVERPRSFEVASVRLTPPQTPPSRRVTDTRVDIVNMSLRALLVRVFQIDQPSLLVTADWLNTVNVDIHATIPEGSTRAHVPEMLKTLLIARFGMRVHTEPRPTDVYELVVGSGGAQIEEVPAADEVDKVFPADPSGKPPSLDRTSEGIEGRMRSITTARGLITITEQSMYERIRTDRGTEEIVATRITMRQLAAILSFTVDRPVVDGTRLSGLYKFRIELPPPNFAIASVFVPITPTNEPNVVSPLRAVEKLGLKLERRRLPVDTIVVDQIARAPTEN